MLAGRHLALHVVEQLVLEEDHRVVVPDRRREQALGVGRGGRHHALQPRHVREHRIVAAGVLAGGSEAGADHRPDHHRHLCLASEHVAELGALVEDLVHAHAEEVDEHELGHRPEPCGGRADRRADETRLRDRCVQDALAPVLLDEALGDSKDATPGVLVFEPGYGGAARHVLAHQHDGRVTCHLLVEALVDRLAEGQRPYGYSHLLRLPRSSQR